jgi:hypothetical protein
MSVPGNGQGTQGQGQATQAENDRPRPALSKGVGPLVGAREYHLAQGQVHAEGSIWEPTVNRIRPTKCIWCDGEG